MTWIVIVVILLAAFGPVFWLVPSRRDRRLTRLRARARAEGLIVEIKSLPKQDAEAHERVSPGGRVRNPVVETACYGLAFRRKIAFLPGWRMVRKRSDSPDPFPDWSFDERPEGPEGRRYLATMLEVTEPFMKELPEDVLALKVTSGSAHFYSLERATTDEATITDLAARLRGLESAFRELEVSIQADREDNDS